MGRQLGRDVYFMPHVAPHFRGIGLTVSAELEREGWTGGDLYKLYKDRYDQPIYLQALQGQV